MSNNCTVGKYLLNESITITKYKQHTSYEITIFIELAISTTAEFQLFFRADDEISVNYTTCYINRGMKLLTSKFLLHLENKTHSIFT